MTKIGTKLARFQYAGRSLASFSNERSKILSNGFAIFYLNL